MNQDVELYATVLMQAADLLDTLNVRKKDKEITAVAIELRGIATELLNQEHDDVEKSRNIIVRLISWIKSILN